jgi:hypothetical protein
MRRVAGLESGARPSSSPWPILPIRRSPWAEIASELRRGADYVRVTVALTVAATDVADALAVAWDAFGSAARDDITGREVTAAAAEVQPEPPLTCAAVTLNGTLARRSLGRLPARGGRGPFKCCSRHPR